MMKMKVLAGPAAKMPGDMVDFDEADGSNEDNYISFNDDNQVVGGGFVFVPVHKLFCSLCGHQIVEPKHHPASVKSKEVSRLE